MAELLKVENLSAGCGEAVVLHDVPAGAQVIQLDDQADPVEDGAVDA